MTDTSSDQSSEETKSNLVLRSDCMKTALAPRGFSDNQASEIMKEVNMEGTNFW